MFFIAVRFSDEKIARLFDLARLILQPDFARPSHITLRGPYPQKSNISENFIGKDVGVLQVRRPGTFFEGTQNTVFLDIEISGIADIWRKPDYPNGVPHLTIYDGKDRNFAWVIFRALSMHKWKLSLNSSPMHFLDAKRPLETDFLLEFEKYRDTFRILGDGLPSAEKIKFMPALDRIILANRIFALIHTLARR
jgi:hypothetical protein